MITELVLFCHLPPDFQRLQEYSHQRRCLDFHTKLSAVHRHTVDSYKVSEKMKKQKDK